mmetsp:Transcript_10931/g.20369  ORF Transcript_10931/g.20369 Transcript_10931/m.20369 type:complete len:81 (+) Transcript_10931:878-1120(+)
MSILTSLLNLTSDLGGQGTGFVTLSTDGEILGNLSALRVKLLDFGNRGRGLADVGRLSSPLVMAEQLPFIVVELPFIDFP